MRGVIQHEARAQQIIDYRELCYGKITPTDVDGVIEYKDKAYVFLEIKYMDKDMPYGQRLAFERLVRDTSKSGKQSIAILAEHDIHDTGQSIPAHDCMVREICHLANYRWREPKRQCTVKEMIDSFLNWVDTND